jgi:putative membrane protein
MDNRTKTWLIVGGIIVGVIIVALLIYWMVGGWQGYYGYGMMGGSFGGLWIIMPILMVVFWGLVIWGLIALFRNAGSSGSRDYQTRTESALELLKKRYARGEISKEEFEEKKKDLS